MPRRARGGPPEECSHDKNRQDARDADRRVVLVLLAGAAGAVTPNIEKCEHKLGVMAVAEPHGGWSYLSSYQLGSPEQLLRMMVQDSGCFDVVERGVAMQNIQQERSLAEGGELRGESNVGKGQMQAPTS